MAALLHVFLTRPVYFLGLIPPDQERIWAHCTSESDPKWEDHSEKRRRLCKNQQISHAKRKERIKNCPNSFVTIVL
jgi:hypothetical protein